MTGTREPLLCRGTFGAERRRHETLLARQSVQSVIYAVHVGCTAAAPTRVRQPGNCSGLKHYSITLRLRREYEQITTVYDKGDKVIQQTRPHRRRTWMIQSYSPGCANVHSHLTRPSLSPPHSRVPNGISIGSAVFAGLTIVTGRQTGNATPLVTLGRIYEVLQCGLKTKFQSN